MDVKSCHRYRVRKESLCLKVKLLLGFASGDFHPSQCHSCSRRAAGGLIQCRVSSLLYAELFLTPAFRCGLAASAVQGWSPPGCSRRPDPLLAGPALHCREGSVHGTRARTRAGAARRRWVHFLFLFLPPHPLSPSL